MGSNAADILKVRQPDYFDRFHCIGADCEDTCCVGWGIPVDRETYGKYLSLPSHRIGDKTLGSLIEINPASSSSGDFARLRLEGAKCPALHDNLCAIQQSLGEPYLPDLCSKYPRVLNVVGDALERSLHLSCPEAARLVLEDPGAMTMHQRTEEQLTHRSVSLNLVSTDPEDCLHRIPALLMEWIQDRSRPLWQRIVALEFVIEAIAGLEPVRAVAVLEELLGDFRQGSVDPALAALKPDPMFQLETVLELVVARIGSDYTAPRFLECYKDFMLGLDWKPDTGIEKLTDRYSRASQNIFQPFVRRHQYVLENYVANYIFRTVFPYRSRLPERKLAIDSGGASMRHSFMLLAVHYAIIRTVLIGMAALYKDDLGSAHAVKLIQSYSKAFLHSTAFEEAATQYLDKNDGRAAGRIAQLVMD